MEHKKHKWTYADNPTTGKERQGTKYTKYNEGMGNRRETQLETIRQTRRGRTKTEHTDMGREIVKVKQEK